MDIIVIVFIILCLSVAIVPFILMTLWNWLAPLFWVGAPILTFWQSFGIYVFLLILSNLFKSDKNN